MLLIIGMVFVQVYPKKAGQPSSRQKPRPLAPKVLQIRPPLAFNAGLPVARLRMWAQPLAEAL